MSNITTLPRTSGRVHSGYRHELVITDRPTIWGHLLAIVFAGLVAMMVVGVGL